MYSALTAPKNGPLKLIGTHQKLDRISRKCLKKILKSNNEDNDIFPSSREIIYFEGRRGPDGLKLKSPGKDEPLHFIIPDNDDGTLIEFIENHYYNLTEALKSSNRTRAAFEAAWLAHAITDGLTPAHHFPLKDAVEDLMGEKEFFEIFGHKIKGIMRGDSVSEAARNNWKYWGVNGVMSRHIAFEYAIALVASSPKDHKISPKFTKTELNKKFDLKKEFYFYLKEINKLEMYQTFGEKGWTPTLHRETEKILLPVIIRLITLSWYNAIKASKQGKML